MGTRVRAKASQRARVRASPRATMIMAVARAKERASPRPEDMMIIMERARAKAKENPKGDISRPGTAGTAAGMIGRIPVTARVQARAGARVTGDHCRAGLLCEANSWSPGTEDANSHSI